MRLNIKNFFIQNFESRAGRLIFIVFFLSGEAAGAALGVCGVANAPCWTSGYLRRLLQQGAPSFPLLLLRTARFWLLFYALGFTKFGVFCVPLLIFLRGLLSCFCCVLINTCSAGILGAASFSAHILLELPVTMLLSVNAFARSRRLCLREPGPAEMRNEAAVALLAIPAALAQAYLYSRLPAGCAAYIF
jgi:hypothetical protein